MTTAPLLEITDLVVEHRQGPRSVRAVDGFDLVMREGETVAIVGESGAGKSTVGRAVLGDVPVTRGSVLVDGRPVERTDLPSLRRRRSSAVQPVFQNVAASLNPARRVRVSLEDGLLGTTGRASRRIRIAETLLRVGLPGDAGDRYPAEFSGGQRQRLALARALLASPRLLICDEALSALDRGTQATIIDLLRSVNRELGVATLFITHDLTTVGELADRLVVMRGGQVVEAGPTGQVLEHPATAYTRLLVASTPLHDPLLQAERRVEAARLRDEFRAARIHIPTNERNIP